MSATEIILSNTAAVAVLGFLFKVWIEKRLSFTLNKELEEFKGKITKEVAQISVREQFNHSKKMELFTELNELMVETDLELKTLYRDITIKNYSGIEERSIAYCTIFLKMNSLLHKNELFIEDEIIDSIKSAYHPIFNTVNEVIGSGDMKGFKKLELPKGVYEIMDKAEEPRKIVLGLMKKASGIHT
jgi:hypothetical protein